MRNIFKKIITYRILSILYSFLNTNNNLDYVLIKKNINFPFIDKGSDLDILTHDLKQFEYDFKKFIGKKLKKYIYYEFKSSDKLHIDFFLGKYFFLKLDLIDLNHNLKNINDSKKFLKNALEGKKVFAYRFLLKKYTIFTPNLSDEVILRNNEYENYPHKIHHKEFINLQKDDYLKEINKKYSSFLINPIKKI
tara:strand:- start:2191 stop:2769 length:579 start_codon:yes stop_codon:yes gene_type:complete